MFFFFGCLYAKIDCSEALDKATLQGLQAAQEAALTAASKSASKAINKVRPERCDFWGTKMSADQAAEKDAKEAAFQEALATWLFDFISLSCIHGDTMVDGSAL